MGLLDNYTGIGMSPRPKWQHQRVMDSILHYSFNELKEQGLFLLTEATVTDDWDDLAPDLVIFNENYNPLSIIEITTHNELRKIIRKCYELIDRFPDSEYFVYDYEKKVLFMYENEHDRWLSSVDYELYSKYLTKPIMNYINE